jgi:hypothetical protein
MTWREFGSSKMDELCHFLDGTVFVRAEECQAVLCPNMSALPPKADMCSALAHVCFGPKADIPPPPLSLRGSAGLYTD